MRLADLCPVPLPAHDALPLEVHLGSGLRELAFELASDHLGAHPLVLADPHTSAAVGPLCLGTHRRRVLPMHPHADVPTVADVQRSLSHCTGGLAIGSGTVNDLMKRASTLEGKPFVVLGTAASMNGYASAIAALLDNGVKTTVPARPARAIILDTAVLAAAPAALTQAGIGDLISKPVSDSCWWLASQLGEAEYSALPSQVVDAAVAEAQRAAPGLKARDPEAHAALGKALVLSGVAMVVAGSSSPASGGEHLLSHLWDMENLVAGRETRLHGAQVGVATCITAALYQRLLTLDAPDVQPVPKWAGEAARIRKAHGPLAEAVLPFAKRKHAKAKVRRARLRDGWAEIRAGLEARGLPKPAEIRAVLDAAGAPSTLAALGVARADAARVFGLARDIRDRVTVLDVAHAFGLLPAGADDLLDAAGV